MAPMRADNALQSPARALLVGVRRQFGISLSFLHLDVLSAIMVVLPLKR